MQSEASNEAAKTNPKRPCQAPASFRPSFGLPWLTEPAVALGQLPSRAVGPLGSRALASEEGRQIYEAIAKENEHRTWASRLEEPIEKMWLLRLCWVVARLVHWDRGRELCSFSLKRC